MPTTRQIQPHFRTLSGMDATTPPHLVADDKWIYLSGMRSYYGKLVQLPRLSTLPALGVGGVPGTDPALAVFGLPQAGIGQNTIIAITKDNVFRVALEDPSLSITLGPVLTTESGYGSPGYLRTGTVYADQLWFLGPTLNLRSTDGSFVKQYGIQKYTGQISVAFSTTTTYAYNSLVMLNVSGFGVSGSTAPFNFTVWSADPRIGGAAILGTGTSTTGLTFISTNRFGITRTGAFHSFLAPGVVLQIPSGAVSIYLRVTINTPGGSVVIPRVISDMATFTSDSITGALFRVLPGDKVCLRGFQNAQFNGSFTVIDTPTTLKFTFKLRGNPGTTTDPNLGTFEFCNVSDVPSAMFIESWFDHLVVANCTYKGQYEPSKVRISDLYRPDVWEPTAENEADEFNMVISQPSDCLTSGVTGMAKLGDTLYVYTQTSITPIQYVGLPKVIQVGAAIEGYGNAFPGSLISNGHTHFFFDVKWKNFFRFDGSSLPQPIGDSIIGYLLPLLGITALMEQQYPVHTEVNYEKNEISWCFGTQKIPFFDSNRTVIYNWLSNSWYVYSVNAVSQGFIWPVGGNRPRMVDEVVTSIDNSNPPIDTYSWIPQTIQVYNRLASRAEAVGGVDIFTKLEMETKDFTTDLQRVVEVDRITLHADYTTSSGIDVWVSARNSIQSALNYKKVGTWTKNTIDGIVSFKPMPGRLFRYKFLPASDTDGLVFYAFTDNVFNTLAER